MSQKITPSLWFNGNAVEAVEFYDSIFPDSRVLSKSFYPKSQEEGLAEFQLDLAGKELTIDFQLGGMRFTAINAGPEFTPNPSISFMVVFDPIHDDMALEHLDELWDNLIVGGEVLMPIDTYFFSRRYGWVKDRYGISWQLNLANNDAEQRPFIMPSLMFSMQNTNHAKEAIAYYTSIFNGSRTGFMAEYDEDSGPAKAGSLMYADFMLAGQWFTAMDSGREQGHAFNEAISFSIACDDQKEIDYFWEKLSSIPEAEQCGWCKDKYGLSWQIVPNNMEQLMSKPDAFAHMMQMKKIEIANF